MLGGGVQLEVETKDKEKRAKIKSSNSAVQKIKVIRDETIEQRGENNGRLSRNSRARSEATPSLQKTQHGLKRKTSREIIKKGHKTSLGIRRGHRTTDA